MKAVILAGGLGTRLMEETVTCPKPMVEIGGQPILWHILSIYAHHGVRDFIICAGYKGYRIKEYFANLLLHRSDVTFDLGRREVSYLESSRTVPPWRVTVVDTGEGTNTGGRLKRIAHLLHPDEPFCMTYGDGLGDVDIAAAVDLHNRMGRLVTMTVARPPARFGSLRLDGPQVVDFREKDPADSGYINGGFFVIDPGALTVIDGDDTAWEREPLERLTARRELTAYVHDGFWQPMDTLREKKLLEELWTSGRAPWKVWA